MNQPALSSMPAPACVGILDSGIGGLTVWSAIKARMPQLPCLYVADQAHLPYGPRPQTEIRALVSELSEQLLEAGARLIVLACNTASAAALSHLRTRFPDTPFVGMEPAVKPAALHTRTGVVGLMATRGTLQGELLRTTAARFAGTVKIVSSECPGLAEAIEAGADSAVLRARLDEILEPMRAAGVDTVVLGCTHYPLIASTLTQVLGPTVHLIDPAPAIARQVERLWTGRVAAPGDRFASTGDPDRLRAMLRRHFQLDTTVEHWPG